MAERRKVTPVELTEEQRSRLENLWFVFGNRGQKTSPANHNFIQRLLENGYDERPLYTKRTPAKDRPTEECQRAVDEILSQTVEPATTAARGKGRGTLRLVENNVQPVKFDASPDLKGMIEEMKLRERAKNLIDAGTDPPEAA